MSIATLRGSDHPEIGEIASVAEGPAAIAISRGGARKTYPYLDPNEDMAGFALSEWGAVVVVADGHSGCEAAGVAVDQVLEAHASRWLEPAPIALDVRFASEAAEVAADVNQAILKATTGSESQGSRTTLTLALVRPREGWLAALSVGDSHAFLAGADAARELVPQAGAPSIFLGDPALSREELAVAVRVERIDATRGRALVLATDGLSERGIGVDDPTEAVRAAVRDAQSASADLRSLEAARGLLRRALDAHRRNRSGDNTAAAVLWID
jgi:serine/threonine protein phosphatase PrpC